MTLRPCLVCGEPSAKARCPIHAPKRAKPSRELRGYDEAWRQLSKRARRLQPFCSRCGSTNDLQTDHTPEAWARKDAGLAIRIEDVDVLCGPCNRDAGAARGPHATRGEAPSRGAHRPQGKAKFELHTGGLS